MTPELSSPVHRRQRRVLLQYTCLFVARYICWLSPESSKIIKRKLAVHVRYLFKGHTSEEKWTEEPGEPSKHDTGFPQIRKWKGDGERWGGGSNEAKMRHWNVRLTEIIKPLERSLAQTSFTRAESPGSELASWMPLRSQSTGCSMHGKRSLHLKAGTGMHFRAQQPGPISQ